MVDSKVVHSIALKVANPQSMLTVGEPAQGLAGWRLTHQQAKATLPIAINGPQKVVRYGDAPLLTAVLQDDLLRTSLQELYLAPLRKERGGGRALRATLRAYFSADCNVSSTAAALNISRQTVASRLKKIENRIGKPVAACVAELETALQLDELDKHAASATP